MNLKEKRIEINKLIEEKDALMQRLEKEIDALYDEVSEISEAQARDLIKQGATLWPIWLKYVGKCAQIHMPDPYIYQVYLTREQAFKVGKSLTSSDREVLWDLMGSIVATDEYFAHIREMFFNDEPE
jgi:hypothetical protein